MSCGIQLSRVEERNHHRSMSSLPISLSSLTLFQINSKNKDLVILRLCNELLRRLSRAEDPVFCGRVYIFMFQSFPLGDKSSVNLRGNFHVENVTTFEDFLKQSKPEEDSMQIDIDGPAPAIKEDSKLEDPAILSGDIDKSKDAKPTTLDTESLYPRLLVFTALFLKSTKAF